MCTNTKNKEFIDLQDSLKTIYKVFGCYKKPPSNLTCLDYGPTKEELEIFHRFELYELPCEFMNNLEFYDETWNSWGNCQEVKYFLPRLFECMVLYWLNTEEHKPCFFNRSINYKLKNLDNWTQEEQKVIRTFSENLFLYFIKQDNLKFIDEVFDLHFSINNELSCCKNVLWTLPKEFKEKVFYAIFNEWLHIDNHKYPTKYFIKQWLGFKKKKQLLLNDVLQDNDLLLELEFLYQEPWDNLILQGITN
jgi:hypothetical protein